LTAFALTAPVSRPLRVHSTLLCVHHDLSPDRWPLKVVSRTPEMLARGTAFGGAALSFLYQFTPDSQDVWIGLTLSVVILGGLGSIPGAFAAGLLLGVGEAVTSAYISVRWAAAVPTLLILVVLLIRPQGLFTRAARQDVAT